MPSAANSLTVLNKEFDEYVNYVKPLMGRYLETADLQSCRAWICALTRRTDPANRNRYMRVMCHQFILEGLGPPFTERPPSIIPKLPDIPTMASRVGNTINATIAELTERNIVDWRVMPTSLLIELPIDFGAVRQITYFYVSEVEELKLRLSPSQFFKQNCQVESRENIALKSTLTQTEVPLPPPKEKKTKKEKIENDHKSVHHRNTSQQTDQSCNTISTQTTFPTKVPNLLSSTNVLLGKVQVNVSGVLDKNYESKVESLLAKNDRLLKERKRLNDQLTARIKVNEAKKESELTSGDVLTMHIMELGELIRDLKRDKFQLQSHLHYIDNLYEATFSTDCETDVDSKASQQEFSQSYSSEEEEGQNLTFE